jgi:hypothetical protein
MKKIYLAVAALFLIAGCAPTKTGSMETTDSRPSKVYIDSVKKVNQDGKPALQVMGNYPDSCTYLEEVTHSIKNGEIHMQLTALRKNMMCSQMLVPFYFVYEKLTEDEISGHSKVIINGTNYAY